MDPLTPLQKQRARETAKLALARISPRERELAAQAARQLGEMLSRVLRSTARASAAPAAPRTP